MKKNLFGAVSVALALALAITSFGCESGNDDPVMLATDADNPITKGFTYILAPSEYEYSGNDKERPDSGSDYGSWVWENYKDGVNKWNRLSGTTTTTWDEATRGTVKGDAVGDVIKTKFSTFTLNADGTWAIEEISSNKEILGVTRYPDTNYATFAGYDAYVAVPAKERASTVGGTDFDAVAVGEGTASAAFAVTPGYVDDIDDAITLVEAASEVLSAAITDDMKDNPNTNKDILDATDEAIAKCDALLETLKAEKAAIEAGKVIDKVVIEETNEGGVKVYYAGKTAVYTVETDGSAAADAVEGTYKFLSGGYLNGTILITSDADNVYDDDNDVYYKVDGGIWRGVISVDFPKTGATTAGSINQKKGRTLTISNGVLTANAVRLTPTNADDYINSFYFGGVYTSYTDAYKDEAVTDKLLNPRMKSPAWTIVQ